VPTALALLGLPAPAGLDGRSLVPFARVNEEEAPPSYAESDYGARHFGWSPLRSLRDGAWKYIDAPAAELYDLRSDPGERQNRLPEREPLGSAMARTLQGFGGAESPAAARGGGAADAANRLRGLGYVTGQVSLGTRRGADPKTEIARYEAYVGQFNDGLARLEQGQARDAERIFRGLARAYPQAYEARQYLGRALAARGAYRDAVAALDEAIALAGDEAAVYFDEARTLADAGEIDRALRRVDEGRRLEPSSFYGALTDGLVAQAAGQPDRAERAFREAVRLNPTLSVAHYELGRIAERRGDPAAARAEYQRALDGDDTFEEARRALARLTGGR
jgi:tetratricopeptide (TPR) repeat protein